MIVLLLNFIGLCFSIFIIVIVILTWTNTNKLVHNETFLGGESIIPPGQCSSFTSHSACEGTYPKVCQWTAWWHGGVCGPASPPPSDA